MLSQKGWVRVSMQALRPTDSKLLPLRLERCFTRSKNTYDYPLWAEYLYRRMRASAVVVKKEGLRRALVTFQSQPPSKYIESFSNSRIVCSNRVSSWSAAGQVTRSLDVAF
eukprot:6213707-Pleurochrysis_carterae.AAC.5